MARARWWTYRVVLTTVLMLVGPNPITSAANIEGKINLKGLQKQFELQVGCLGKDKQGQRIPDSMVSTSFSIDDSELSASNKSFAPRETLLAWKIGKGCTYKHTNLPAGDYLVYVRSGAYYFDWRSVRITEAQAKEKLAVNLSIDPNAMAAVEITVTGNSEVTSVRFHLLDEQGKLPPGDQELPDTENEIPLKKGKATVEGFHIGKYRFATDKASVDVEVKKNLRTKVELKEPK